MKMERLIKLRKARKMSQEVMSGLIGVSCRAYASWEAGDYEMRASNLRRISEILKVPMENIFNDSPEIGYSPPELPPSPSAPPPSMREAKDSNNIEIEIELPGKSKVRFSIPPDIDEDKIGKLITQIANEK